MTSKRVEPALRSVARPSLDRAALAAYTQHFSRSRVAKSNSCNSCSQPVIDEENISLQFSDTHLEHLSSFLSVFGNLVVEDIMELFGFLEHPGPFWTL